MLCIEHLEELERRPVQLIQVDDTMKSLEGSDIVISLENHAGGPTSAPSVLEDDEAGTASVKTEARSVTPVPGGERIRLRRLSANRLGWGQMDERLDINVHAVTGPTNEDTRG